MEHSQDEIRWEDPKPRRRGTQADLDVMTSELRAHPGRWAVVREYGLDDGRKNAYPYTALLKRGRIKAFTPVGDWEATTRTDGEVIKVYARYIGNRQAVHSVTAGGEGRT